MRVLVLEDDEDLRWSVVQSLRAASLAVDEAADIPDADVAISVNRYDCYVLDRTVPSGDSMDLLVRLRAAGDATPALFLTAKATITARIDGFKSGADDYLTKPFAMEELVVRVRSLCRRSETARPTLLRSADLEVDLGRREVRRGGVLLTLTPKELSILEVLLTEAGQVVSQSQLIERCWDEHADPFSNVVEVNIATLRRKLGQPPVIRTVRGAGYVIDS